MSVEVEDGFNWKENCFLCGGLCGRKGGEGNSKTPLFVGNFSVVRKDPTMYNRVVEVCQTRCDEWGLEVLSRLKKCDDLIAAEARYHSLCHTYFKRYNNRPTLKMRDWKHRHYKSKSRKRSKAGRPSDTVVQKRWELFDEACKQLKESITDDSFKVAVDVVKKMKDLSDDPNDVCNVNIVRNMLRKRFQAENSEEPKNIASVTSSVKDVYFEPRNPRSSKKKVYTKVSSENKNNSEDSTSDSGDDYEPLVKLRYRAPSRKESAQQPNRKSLVVKNLPESATEADILGLSADIQTVRLDQIQYGDDRFMRYAVIHFKDENTAEDNYKSMVGAKVNGVDVIVDYVGRRSIASYLKIRLKPSSDPLRLYVTGFGREFNDVGMLKKLFPTSTDILIPIDSADNRPVGFAFIQFPDEESARLAHDSTQDYIFQERTLLVTYANKSSKSTELDQSLPSLLVTYANKSSKSTELDQSLPSQPITGSLDAVEHNKDGGEANANRVDSGMSVPPGDEEMFEIITELGLDVVEVLVDDL